MTEQFANEAITTLAENIDGGETTFDVTSATLMPTSGSFRIKIQDEICIVTGRSTNTLTVIRAQEGTTPSSHSSGTTVTVVLTAGALENILNGDGNDQRAVNSQCLAGADNFIGYSEYGQLNVILGGSNHQINEAVGSAIVGGANSLMELNGSWFPNGCTIVGGNSNTITPTSTAHANYSTIVGGSYNTIKGSQNVILGGDSNTVHSPVASTVVMGSMASTGGDSTGGGYPVIGAMIHGHNMDGFAGTAQKETHLCSAVAGASATVPAYTDGASTSTHITLPVNCYATGQVYVVAIRDDGSSFHRIIYFSAANVGFGPQILSQATPYSHDEGGVGVSVSLSSDTGSIYANCSGTYDFAPTKFFVSFEFIRIYAITTGATS